MSKQHLESLRKRGGATLPTVAKAFETYSTVYLARPVRAHDITLPAGTRGTIVDPLRDGWYLVEINDPIEEVIDAHTDDLTAADHSR